MLSFVPNGIYYRMIFKFCFREFQPVIQGFEQFAVSQLRSMERQCPGACEGYDWPPLRAVSLTLEMKLCSKLIVVENARLVLADE